MPPSSLGVLKESSNRPSLAVALPSLLALAEN
jgi:hypothetical protein